MPQMNCPKCDGDPNFWMNISELFYASDDNAFMRGAIIVGGGFIIVLIIAVFATSGDQ